MSAFGFTFEALYRLQVGELQDMARLIRGEGYYPPRTRDVLIRGVIFPFLRDAAKLSKTATKDEVMRAALIRAARGFQVSCDDWDAVSTEWTVRQVKAAWEQIFRKQLETLGKDERAEILKKADDELKKRARGMGISLLPAVGVIAGEMSGFGIYIATTTGLSAISAAIGITFPWAIYQGATTLLGVVLGPVGWIISGTCAAAGIAVAFQRFLKQGDKKLQVIVLAIIQAIGDNPYEWFGLSETAPMDEIKTAYRAMMKTLHPDVLEERLADWLKQRFNELLLRTQENYERIQMHREEAHA